MTGMPGYTKKNLKQDVENAGFSQVYVLEPGDTHELK